MWVYKAKGDKNDCFLMVKGRLTLRGDQAKFSIGRLEAYAPVANTATPRVMIARWLCEDGVRFFIDDIGQAFVSTSQVRKVYVNHPPGYEIFENKEGNIDFRENTPGKPGHKRMSTVMPLQLNLYGGVEAGRIFYDVYRDWHLTNGFTESHYDQCYFEKTWPNGDFIRKSIHVDDGIGCYKGEDK